MVTIVTRSGKGSALTNTEIDTNFTNLNTGKVEDVPARATYLPSLLLDFANGESLDPRVSFARSSTATYYDGVTVAKAEENLLLRSQEFNSSPWQVDGVTVTADSAAAPDGTATADIITVGAAVNFKKIVQVTQLSQGLQYTFSVWVLAGTASSVTLYLGGNTVTAATVLSGPATAGATGSSGCTFSNLSASTWSRIRITVTTTVAGSAEANIYPGNWSAQSIGDSVIAWGAQLEQRSSVTAYTPTNAPIASGTELVTNGNFSAGSTGWTVVSGWAITSQQAVATATSSSLYGGSVTSVSGQWYRVEFDVVSYTSGDLYIAVGGNYSGNPMLTGSAMAAGRKTMYVLGGANTTRGVEFYGGVITCTIDNISVQAITSYGPGPITNYIPRLLTAPANTPRFQHDPVTGESLGLLIEEQRTNLLTYSEQFDNAAWTKINSPTIASNVATSPDGATTADSIQAVTGGTFQYVAQTATVASNATVTASIFVKKETSETAFGGLGLDFQGGTRRIVYVGVNAVTGVANNLVGGTLTGTVSVFNAGNYWRVNVTATDNGSNTSCFFLYYANLSTDNVNVSGTPAASSAKVIWGAQLEVGSFATSYIPTVASQVTRNADSASMTGTNFSSWYNPSEGTLCIEAAKTSAAQGNFVVGLGYSSTNYIGLLYNTGGANTYIQPWVGSFGTTSFSSGATTKAAVGYKVNDYASVINGALSTNTSPGPVPSGTSGTLYLGTAPFASNTITSCTIRRIAYYPERLPNADLQSLTA